MLKNIIFFASDAAANIAGGSEAVTDAAKSKVGTVNFDAFLDTLPMMAKGMLGIFLVTAVIIGSVYLLGLIKRRDK